jgi:hypothetical protein
MANRTDFLGEIGLSALAGHICAAEKVHKTMDKIKFKNLLGIDGGSPDLQN